MNSADREILKHFRQIRQRTIDLVERIPEEMLTRQADGEALPLGRLFKHIAYVVDSWMDDFLQDGKGRPKYQDDKTSILAALEFTAGRLVSFFEAEDGWRMGQEHPTTLDDGVTPVVWTGRDRVLYLTDHEVHHRGKIVLALRQWGFEDIPPMPLDW
ncbi:MAG TPA: DinB family protein [Thermoanaerobaculia bacterium]|nr:DinB family protein [Thermoanaerobaculia bacterium]